MNSTSRAVPPAAGARAATLLDRLWRASPPLTAVGALMVAVAVASLVAMLVDPRVITGAPAWLKPFKFAISTAVYSLTLAWVFGWLTDWPRVRRVVGWVTATVFVLDKGGRVRDVMVGYSSPGLTRLETLVKRLIEES